MVSEVAVIPLDFRPRGSSFKKNVRLGNISPMLSAASGDSGKSFPAILHHPEDAAMVLSSAVDLFAARDFVVSP
jgi:hypothetical protein